MKIYTIPVKKSAAAVKLYREDVVVKLISRRLNISPDSVYRYVRMAGLPNRIRQYKITKETEKNIVKDYAKKYISLPEISHRYSVPDWKIYKLALKHKIPLHVPESRKKNTPEDIVDWIVDAYLSDELSIREIADEVGLNRKTVYYWLKKRGIELNRAFINKYKKRRNYVSKN